MKNTIRYTNYKLNMVLNSASAVTESDTDWMARFDEESRIVFNRYVSQIVEAGTVITISKRVHKGYMGNYYEAEISRV